MWYYCNTNLAQLVVLKRLRMNGEKQHLKTKPKCSELRGLGGKRAWSTSTNAGYARQTKTTKNQEQKQVNGRGGAPAVMHRPAAVEPALRTEKRERSHTASRPYSAAAGAPVYPEARDLRWTKYAWCSNSITCYNNRRFLNVPQ